MHTGLLGNIPFGPPTGKDLRMIKRKLYGNTLKEQLQASAGDRLHVFILADGTVRGGIVNGTRMVNEMRANHELGILETLALGRAYLGVILMSMNLKGNDRLSVQIDCSGPLKGLVVETNAYGEVRGFLKQVPIPIDTPPESFDLSPFIGEGLLTVTRYLQDAKHPFVGKVKLKYGNIALDLANYFLTSEQIPSAFNLSIHFDRHGEVTGAGGLFLQAMPDASEETTGQLEPLIEQFPSLGSYLSEKTDPQHLIETVFKSFGVRFLSNQRIEFLCHCNSQRLKQILSMLPPEQLKDLAENGPFPMEMRCHHCNTPYQFSQGTLLRLADTRKAAVRKK